MNVTAALVDSLVKVSLAKHQAPVQVNLQVEPWWQWPLFQTFLGGVLAVGAGYLATVVNERIARARERRALVTRITYDIKRVQVVLVAVGRSRGKDTHVGGSPIRRDLGSVANDVSAVFDRLHLIGDPDLEERIVRWYELVRSALGHATATEAVRRAVRLREGTSDTPDVRTAAENVHRHFDAVRWTGLDVVAALNPAELSRHPELVPLVRDAREQLKRQPRLRVDGLGWKSGDVASAGDTTV